MKYKIINFLRKISGRILGIPFIYEKKYTFGKEGKNVRFGRYITIIEPEKIIFHDNISFGDNIFIDSSGGLEIEENFISSNGLVILTSSHNYDIPNALPYGSDYIFKKVFIGKNVWIGYNVLITPGVTIGEGAVIAAGSVVTGDIPSLAVVGGNPAKVIKYRNQDAYEKAKEKNITLYQIRCREICKTCKLSRQDMNCWECYQTSLKK